MTEDYAEVPAARLYYRIMGSGDPPVFLHGGPAIPHGYFLPWAEPLSESFKLVFFDQRGCGKSSKAKDHQYDIDTIAADLGGLRKLLQLGRINVLGHSWGGMLAQQYVLAYPGAVKRLLLAERWRSFTWKISCTAASG